MSHHFPFLVASLSVSFLFALAVLLPHILQRFDRAYPFQGVVIMPLDQEDHYAARVREITDGFVTAANVFYDAPKDQPYLFPPLPEWTVAKLGQLLRIDPVRAFVVGKALNAFLLPLSFLGFLVSVSKRPWESLLSVVIFLFAGSVLSTPWNFFAFLQGTADYGFLRFARPINPLWTATWFFLALTLISSWLQKRSVWKVLVAACCTAILLHSYIYAWTYIGVSLFLLFLWFLWRHDWQRCRDLLLFACVWLFLGIPYFLNLIVALQHPWYAETAVRFGLVPKRTPVIGVWIMFFLLLSGFSGRLWKGSWPLLPALSVSGLFVLNQQLLTGQYLVPHHYHWYFIHPLASMFTVLAALSLLARLLVRLHLWRGTLYTLAFIFSLSFGFLQQERAYRMERGVWGERQQFAPVLGELSARTQPGVVVYATPMSALRNLIPVYTSADVYTAANADNYLTPHERARAAFFFDLWLQGVTPQAAQERFYADLRWSVGSRIYSIYYRELLGDYDKIPDDIVAEHVEAYRKYNALSLEEKLRLYPLHLLVLTPHDQLTPHLQALKERGQTLYEQDGFMVVSLVEPKS